jgi:hypothetical protein
MAEDFTGAAVNDGHKNTPTIAPAVDEGQIGGPALVTLTRGRWPERRLGRVQPLSFMRRWTFLRLTCSPSPKRRRLQVPLTPQDGSFSWICLMRAARDSSTGLARLRRGW